MILTRLKAYLTPHLGRFSPSQLRALGQNLHPCGYLAIGPVVVLMDLPERWRKPDPEVTLFDFNAYLRERFPASN